MVSLKAPELVPLVQAPRSARWKLPKLPRQRAHASADLRYRCSSGESREVCWSWGFRAWILRFRHEPVPVQGMGSKGGCVLVSRYEVACLPLLTLLASHFLADSSAFKLLAGLGTGTPTVDRPEGQGGEVIVHSRCAHDFGSGVQASITLCCSTPLCLEAMPRCLCYTDP